MYIDLVFPDKNEEEFAENAIRLGYSGLCFVYSDKNKLKSTITSLQRKNNLKIFYCFLYDRKPNNLPIHADLIIAEHKKDTEPRDDLENKKINLLFNLENNTKEDFLAQRNSGLNHVLCKMAKENDIAMGISFSNLLNSDKFERARLIGRIRQNIFLCRKYKVSVVFASFTSKPEDMRSPNDLRALMGCIFNDEFISKTSLTNINLILEENLKKKDKNYIAKDVRVLE